MTNSKDIVTTRNTHLYDSEKEEKDAGGPFSFDQQFSQ